MDAPSSSYANTNTNDGDGVCNTPLFLCPALLGFNWQACWLILNVACMEGLSRDELYVGNSLLRLRKCTFLDNSWWERWPYVDCLWFIKVDLKIYQHSNCTWFTYVEFQICYLMLVSVSDLLHSSIVYYVLYDQEMEKNRCQSYDRSSLAEASKSQGAHERSPSMKWRISCNAFSISLMQTSIRKTVVVLPKIHPLNVYLFLPFLAVDKVLSTV